MERRVRLAGWLFEHSRIARTLFVVTVWPPVYIADRVRGHEPPSWSRGVQWARNGEYVHEPTIPTSDTPAVVRRPAAEPNCGSCHDSRQVWYGPGSWEQPLKLPCPECCPSTEELTF